MLTHITLLCFTDKEGYVNASCNKLVFKSVPIVKEENIQIHCLDIFCSFLFTLTCIKHELDN